MQYGRRKLECKNNPENHRTVVGIGERTGRQQKRNIAVKWMCEQVEKNTQTGRGTSDQDSQKKTTLHMDPVL